MRLRLAPLAVLATLALGCTAPPTTSHLTRGLGLSVQRGPVLAAPTSSIDSFGWSIALSDDWAVVGAPAAMSSAGAVYVYDRHAGYGLAAAINGAAMERLGMAVAITGDGRIVAAGGSETGVVKVLTKNASWEVSATLALPSDYQPGGAFPSAVAASGGYILVGAASHAHEQPAGTGAVYVYMWDGSQWGAPVGELVPPAGTSNFGQAIAFKGTLIAVGAPGSAPGQVFVYDLAHSWPDPLGPWPLTVSAPAAVDLFGEAVGVDGNTVLGCAWSLNQPPAPDRAAFYAQSPGWSGFYGPLGTPATDGGMIELGTSVDLSQELFVAGGASANANRAFARLFTGPVEWVELAPAVAPISYGTHVAVAGGREVLVSAPSSGNGPGHVFVYTVLRDLGQPCTAHAQCASGWCAGSACGLNPDGGDDAAVPDDAAVDDGAVPEAAAQDGTVADGADGDTAAGDGSAHPTDFYSCDCTVGASAGTPGALALGLGVALAVVRRRQARR